MGDMGEHFKDVKDAGKAKRENNRESSANVLRENNIHFTTNNGGIHLIVEGKDGFIDFWPGTGRWIIRGVAKSGFGVRNLVKEIMQ